MINPCGRETKDGVKASTCRRRYFVLIVAEVGFLYLSLNRVIPSAVETYGPQVTKSEVRLDGVSISPLSGNAQLSDLVVGNPKGYKTPSAFNLGALRLSLNLGSLLSDTIAIRDIIITAPLRRSPMSLVLAAAISQSCKRMWKSSAATRAKGYLSKDASVSNLVKPIHTVHHGELWVERSLIARFFEREDFADVNGEDPHKSTQEELTKRKQEILCLLASGGTHKNIAQT